MILTSALVVDDNFYNRDLARMMLNRLGVSSKEAVDGLDALDKLQSNKFDVLILDLEMPELNGLDVFRALRKDPRHDDMIVILLTAHHDLAREIEADVDYIVYKPMDIREFITFLMKLQFQKP